MSTITRMLMSMGAVDWRRATIAELRPLRRPRRGLASPRPALFARPARQAQRPARKAA